MEVLLQKALRIFKIPTGKMFATEPVFLGVPPLSRSTELDDSVTTSDSNEDLGNPPRGVDINGRVWLETPEGILGCFPDIKTFLQNVKALCSCKNC